MPDPIMDPITSAVELNRPRLSTILGELDAVSVSEFGRLPGVVTYSKF
jgi:hypothetical protein